MKSRPALLVVLILAAFVLGFLVRNIGRDTAPEAMEDHTGSYAGANDQFEATRWTCSMHPQIILPNNDQQCPICFMDLIPLEENNLEGLDPSELALSPQAEALAEIQTAKVRRAPAQRSLRLVGKVKADETRTRTITARVGGRLDRLYVDTTGQLVHTGMKLADIYSPELYSAQTELLAASQLPYGDPTKASVIKRLQLWGMDQKQIQNLLDGGQIKDHLVVTAPSGGVVINRQASQGDYVKTGTILYSIADLDKVWVTLDAYEGDLPWLQVGQEVSFSTRAFAGREFNGEILFINPVLDERMRTVEVRLQVDNDEGLLKPGMLVQGRVEVLLNSQGNPLDPAIASVAAGDWPLVIPATAPLLTGDRAVVYVRREHEGHAVFQGRQVRLGPRAKDQFIVLSGLDEGDEVVFNGAFKIDSALQIKAQPSMMSQQRVNPEFLARLNGMLDGYFPLQTALAADDDSLAARAATALAVRLDQLDTAAGGLNSQGRIFWSGHGPELKSAVRLVRAAANIADRRLAFEALSDHLWAVADQLGKGSNLQARRFHCPMAMDGAGAFWLQNSETVANPYYGATMLRCGSQVEVLQ